jgi:hypothetical protein
MLMKAVEQRAYTFHGVGISISGDTDIAEAIHSRFRHFPMNTQSSAGLTFEFRLVSDDDGHFIQKPFGRARAVYEPPAGEVSYIEEDDHLYISYRDRIRVLCKPALGETQVSIRGSEADYVWLATRPLFTLPLVESLKRRGVYGLHAAGLSLNGKGLLLPGTSGAGKSTLTIALLRAGFDFLTDDTIFLRRDRQGLRMLAFPDEIDVTDETSRLFAELNYLSDLPKRPGARKSQVYAEEAFNADTSWECSPHIMVFPKVADVERSQLKPMSRDDALLEIVSNILLTEALSSQAHMDVLAQLVKQCECYRLETGLDLNTVPLLLRDLIE